MLIRSTTSSISIAATITTRDIHKHYSKVTYRQLVTFWIYERGSENRDVSNSKKDFENDTDTMLEDYIRNGNPSIKNGEHF